MTSSFVTEENTKSETPLRRQDLSVFPRIRSPSLFTTPVFFSSLSPRQTRHKSNNNRDPHQREPFSLIDVGFWADPRDPQDPRPHPSQLVDKEWGATVTARAVALYLRSGYLESFELGYSFCRIGDGCGESGPRYVVTPIPAGCAGTSRGEVEMETVVVEDNIAMGCCTLTDGVYVWPEGFAHYVESHHVRPPAAFVRRAVTNLRALRNAQSKGRLRWMLDDDGKRGKTVPLAPATAVFLRDKTTLGIALPPEKEPESGERATGSLLDDYGPPCSCVAW